MISDTIIKSLAMPYCWIVLAINLFCNTSFVYAQDTTIYYADIDMFTLQGKQPIEFKDFKHKRFIGLTETADKVIVNVYQRGYQEGSCEYIFHKRDGHYFFEDIGDLDHRDKKTILNIYIYIFADKVVYAVQKDRRKIYEEYPKSKSTQAQIYFQQCEILYPTYQERPQVILEVPPSPDLYKLYYEKVQDNYQKYGTYNLIRKDFSVRNDSLIFNANYHNKRTAITKRKLEQPFSFFWDIFLGIRID